MAIVITPTYTDDSSRSAESPIHAMKDTISKMRESLKGGLTIDLRATPTGEDDDAANTSLHDTSLYQELTDPTWAQYQRDAKKLLEDANRGRADDASHLVQTLQVALQNYRSQNADLMERIKLLTVAAEEHLLLQSQQERDKEQLAHELSLARTELASLRASKDLQQHKELDRQYSSGGSRDEDQKQIIGLMKERDEALARINSLEAKLIAKEGYGDIAKLQREIRELQEELRGASVKNDEEMDDERERSKQTISDLMRQLSQANKTIAAYAAAERTSDVQLQRATQRGDEIENIQSQLDATTRELSIRNKQLAEAGARERRLEEQLVEALNQRDTLINMSDRRSRDSESLEALSYLKQLQQTQMELALLQRDTARLRNENMFEREKSYRSLHDHRSQRAALEKSLQESEASSAQRIRALEADIRDKDAQIKSLTERTPYRDEAMMQAYMMSKQREVNLHRSAQTALQTVARQISQDPMAPNTSRHTAELALHTASAASADLPEGWEARTTEKGLVYYIDHQRKLSTWIHPKFGADTITYNARDTAAAPAYSDHIYDRPYSHTEMTPTSSTSSTMQQRQLMANMRTLQERTKVGRA